MDRTDLRNRFIERRRDMTISDVTDKNKQIMGYLETAVDWSTVTALHIYRSVAQWNEVDTSSLADFIQKNHPAISVTTGNPDRSTPPPSSQFDVIIVPIVVFDRELNRLGFGGGWYDRFLALQVKAQKIGLAYDFQQTDHIETRSHDIALDLIVTNSGVLRK